MQSAQTKPKTIWARAGAVSTKRSALVVAIALCVTSIGATLERYKRDPKSPPPPAITPGTTGTQDSPGRAPSDAVVLFDGTNLSQWIARGRSIPKGTDGAPGWKIQNGFMEVVPNSGNLISKEKFADSQIHVEWASPTGNTGDGQKAGNSGVILMGHAEVQVLDSYGDKKTYLDGMAGAIYHYHPPLVNASLKPGEWQSFDILYTAPRHDDAGKVVAPARMTVLHNGIVIQHNAEIPGDAKEYTLQLQDHLSPVRYRNVWVRKLPSAQP